MDPVFSPPSPDHDEYHVHLGGSTPLSLVQMFASLEDAARLQAVAQYVRQGVPLKEFLGTWFTIMERMQGDLDFLEASAYAAASTSPARHFELRFCPFVRKAPVLEQLRRVQRGLQAAALAFPGRSFGLVLIAMRGNQHHLEALEEYLPFASGIDVAGDENQAEQGPLWMKSVRRVYQSARDLGLSTTYHTGEGRLEDTLEVLKLPLVRIGHGISLRHLDQLPASLPVFELCPAVNEVTGVASFKAVLDFALKLHERGHRFVFGSDNPVLTGTTSAAQWDRLPPLLQEAALATGHWLRSAYPLSSGPL